MKLRSFIPLIIIFFIIITAFVYGFVKYIQPKVFTNKSTSAEEPITKDEKIVKCHTGDTACEVRNEKIKVNQLEGTTVESAKHQCDGPRACPTPEAEIDEAAINAIRIYAKDPRLELTRVTGINPNDQLYYCATGNRCWVYSVKEKKVTSYITDKK